jgi:hypothetical protein
MRPARSKYPRCSIASYPSVREELQRPSSSHFFPCLAVINAIRCSFLPLLSRYGAKRRYLLVEAVDPLKAGQSLRVHTLIYNDP